MKNVNVNVMEEKMSEDKERLESNMNAASTSLRRIASGKAGEGVEKVYGQAYQALVKAGFRPQIRKKYR